jgi:hypothetical protein
MGTRDPPANGDARGSDSIGHFGLFGRFTVFNPGSRPSAPSRATNGNLLLNSDCGPAGDWSSEIDVRST